MTREWREQHVKTPGTVEDGAGVGQVVFTVWKASLEAGAWAGGVV